MTTELATIEEAPKFIKEVTDGVAPGMENMTANDIILPRFQLCQALSPAVVEGDNNAGEILNSLSGEIIIAKDENLDIIPLFHYKEWIQWGDREANEGMLERSIDPTSRLAQMAAQGATRTTAGGKEVRIVTEYHCFVCLMPSVSLKIPITLSCCKTSYKTGKKLLSLAKFRGNYALYAGMYELSGKLTKNRAGQQYYILDIENHGWVKDKALYAMAEEVYGQMKSAYDERRLATDQQGDEPVEETEM